MRFGIALTLLFCLCACEPQDGSEVGSSLQAPQENDWADTPQSNNRLYLKSASMGDYALYSRDPGDGVQVVICHVPPGNPMNFKTHIVSVSSLQSHLSHGSQGNEAKNGASHPKAKPQHRHGDSHAKGHSDDHHNNCTDDEESRDEDHDKVSEHYIDEDYLGACGAPEPYDDLIVLDDPVYPEDGIVCEGLTGEPLFDCLAELDQGPFMDL